MNEKFKQLAEQAGADFMRRINYNNLEGKEYEEDAGVIFESTESFEKFAELIVRECVKVALDERVAEEEIDKSDDIEDRCYLRGNNGGIVDAVVAIKQHFGVEE